MESELSHWMDVWDKACAEEAKEQPPPKPQKQTRTSFFNNQPSEQDVDDEEDNLDPEKWQEIYQKAMEIDWSAEDNVLNEEDGFGKLVSGNRSMTKGPITYETNPTNFASVGNDQEGEDGHVRVTKNFSDGPELKELDDVKKHVEAMERRVHASDVLKQKDQTTLKNELSQLRTKLKELSEKVQSNPKTDVA